MQDEIDWQKVHRTRIAACCRRAAEESGKSVEAPFTLTDAALGTFNYVALFPTLGSGRGMLICLSSEWEQADSIAHKHGYSCAGLDPQQYSSYNRDSWLSAFEAWGERKT
jgi:hypothetical protein